MKFTAVLTVLLLSLCACKGGGDSEGGVSGDEYLTLGYARGFNVRQCDGYKLLTVQDPQGESTAVFRFALKKKGCDADIPAGLDVVEIPMHRIVCMTELQLSAFIKLGNTDDVCGISSGRHLFNKDVNARIADGRIRPIGIEGNFDAEVVMSINPDVIFSSPFKRGGTGALTAVGVQLIPYLGYKETTPLGQAEWIKFVGLLTGNEARADSVFREIERRYNEIKSIVAASDKRPSVFSGEPRGGVWYAVGGQSFLANLFRDAGADYFLKDDKRSGGVNLDFEQVYGMAESVDFWRIMNSYDGEFSYDALVRQDGRYADFKAVRDGGVVYCNMRLTPFYESSPMEPEYVLADMVKAFHPELLPDYTPHFYKLLTR